jgi:hypothetical protein
MTSDTDCEPVFSVYEPDKFVLGFGFTVVVTPNSFTSGRIASIPAFMTF